MICFDKSTLIFTIIFLILLILLLYLIFKPYFSAQKCNIINQYPNNPDTPKENDINKENIYAERNDIIRQYDYNRIFDVLEQPVRRIERDQMYPSYFRNIIDIPTRGYPDNFTQVGILIKQGHSRKNEQNKILRLFGRNKFPSSNKYEYYTAINSGLDQIKIPIDNKRKNELFDDDVIYIRELKDSYRVNLHKFDEPKYYPDLF